MSGFNEERMGIFWPMGHYPKPYLPTKTRGLDKCIFGQRLGGKKDLMQHIFISTRDMKL